MDARNVFFGDRGMRAGWRALMFIVLIVIAVFAMGTAANFIGHRLLPNKGHTTGITPVAVLIGETALLLGLALVMAVVVRVEKLSIGEFGLPMRQAFRSRFWVGALWGFLALSALIGIMKLLHAVDLGPVIDPAPIEIKDGLLYAIGFTMVGIFEEFTMRGYLQWGLTRGLGFWPAALITSLLFGAIHAGNPGEHWYGLLAVVEVGLLFCLFLQRTGDLWFPIGFHFAWDWAETYFYGTPDSGGVANGSLFRANFHGPTWVTGGSVGPEGSAFVYVVLALTGILFAVVYRRSNYDAVTAVAANTVVPAPVSDALPEPAS